MKRLENRRANAFNRKSKYYKNKKYISHAILTTKKLGLEYNKLQLAVIIKSEINN